MPRRTYDPDAHVNGVTPEQLLHVGFTSAQVEFLSTVATLNERLSDHRHKYTWSKAQIQVLTGETTKRGAYKVFTKAQMDLLLRDDLVDAAYAP
jgi:hypothetical protein